MCNFAKGSCAYRNCHTIIHHTLTFTRLCEARRTETRVRSRFNEEAKTAAEGCPSPRIVVRRHYVDTCAVHQLEMEKEERSKSRGVRVAAQMKKKEGAEMKGKDHGDKGKKRGSGAEMKNKKIEESKGGKKSMSTSKSSVICGDCEHKQGLRGGG